MRIKKIIVRKEGNTTKAVIISFDTRAEKFESPSERNKFFRGLHGWEQQVPRGEKTYRYRRPGLLDDVPHIKISNSVFMFMAEHMQRVEEYFRQWHEKVEFEMLEVMLQQQKMLKELQKRQQMQDEEEEQEDPEMQL